MIAYVLTIAAALLDPQAANNAAVAAAATPAPVAAQPSAAQKASTKKFCVKEALTGSRMAKTVCKTRGEWQAQGWDPIKD